MQHSLIMSPLFPLLFLLLLSLPLASAATTPSAKPGCPTKCGNVTIPYPFGVGIDSGCSLDKLFDVICNTSSTPPRLHLPESTIDILEIRNDTVRIKNVVASNCYDLNGKVTRSTKASIILSDTPFSVSGENMLTIVGCDELFMMLGFEGRNFSGGCLAQCSNEEDMIEGECSGIGCAQSNIPKGFKSFVSSLGSVYKHENISSFATCGYAFLADPERFVFSATDLSDPNFLNKTRDNVPMILEWEIGTENCSVAKNYNGFACHGNTSCHDSTTGFGGYRCSCLEGYEGNPYLSPGCIGIYIYFLYKYFFLEL